MKRIPLTTLRLLLVALALGCGALLVRVPWAHRLEADVMALVADAPPGTGGVVPRDALAGQARTVAVLVEGPDAASAADDVADRLAALDSVEAAAPAGAGAFAPMGKLFLDQRMQLLFPRWLARHRDTWQASHVDQPFPGWLAQTAADELLHFLGTPQSMAFAQLIPRDPLLLLPSSAEGLSGKGGTGDRAVVLATLRVPPTDHTAQAGVTGAIDSLRTELAGRHIQLTPTGAVFFARESERRIRSDVLRLNLLMTGLLVVIVVTLLRSARAAVSVVLPVLLAAMVAVIAVMYSQSTVHALALGIAGILGGIAVDYPIHVLLHRRDDEPDFASAARRVALPLAIGCLTTVTVFLFLLLSGQALIRQVGLLVGVGLLAAGALTVPCLLALPPGRPLPAAQRLSRGRLPGGRRAAIAVGAVMALLALGLVRIRWHDGLDVMQVPLPTLQADASRVLAATPGGGDDFRVITLGATLGQAVERARDLKPLASPVSALATPAELAAAEEWTAANGPAFQSAFSAALQARGFDTTDFEPLFADTPDAHRYGVALERLPAALPPGLRWTVGDGAHGAWIVQSLPGEPALLPAGSWAFSPREALDAAFAGYRRGTLVLAGWGFGAACLLVLFTAGFRTGLAIVAIPLLADGATAGLHAWLGRPLNLFHLVGLLLGFGLAIDYAVFTLRGGGSRASVRLSALTTLGAFLVLTTSAIPAVQALGATVFLVVGSTLLLCELLPHHDERPAGATAAQAPGPPAG